MTTIRSEIEDCLAGLRSHLLELEETAAHAEKIQKRGLGNTRTSRLNWSIARYALLRIADSTQAINTAIALYERDLAAFDQAEARP